jgi:hypothetical protein
MRGRGCAYSLRDYSRHGCVGSVLEQHKLELRRMSGLCCIHYGVSRDEGRAIVSNHRHEPTRIWSRRTVASENENSHFENHVSRMIDDPTLSHKRIATYIPFQFFGRVGQITL